MVAIVTILATMVGAFAMGLGGLTTEPPRAAVTVDGSESGQYKVQVMDIGTAEELHAECGAQTTVLTGTGESGIVGGDCDSLTILGTADGEQQVLQTAEQSSLSLAAYSFAHADEPTDCSDVHSRMAQDDDGTYVVTTDHELQCISEQPGADYKLGNSIDVSGTRQWNTDSTPAGFDPISGFSGTFDGQGYEIRGLMVNRSDIDNVGLFGTIDTGRVENVSLTEAEVSGSNNVGVLAGSTTNNSTVTTISTAGIVSVVDDADVEVSVGGLIGSSSNTNISQASSSASVVDDSTYADAGGGAFGGLVGRADSTSVKSSSATGDVAASSTDLSMYVGGLIGTVVNNSRVTSSYAAGDASGGSRTGGLLGSAITSEVHQTGASGDVAILDDNGGYNSYAGGHTGYIRDGNLTKSYATGDVEGANKFLGGLAGIAYAYNDDVNVKTVYATGTVSNTEGADRVWPIAIGFQNNGTYNGEDQYVDSTSNGDDFTSDGAKVKMLSTGEMTGNSAEASMDFDWDDGSGEEIWTTRSDNYPIPRTLTDLIP